MDEEKSQKELFEFEEPKKPFSKLTNMLPKPDFEGRVAITLTLEKMVFISIGIVMLMVIVFALGVESGKSRKLPARREPVQQKTAAAQKTLRPPVRPLAPIAAMQPSAATQKGFLNTAPVAPGTKTPAQKAPEASRPYTIVAATFSKKDTAQATAVFLNKEGLSAFIVYSDPYYRVCVGAYADMYSTEVQRDLIKVKKIYKDAFVRLR